MEGLHSPSLNQKEEIMITGYAVLNADGLHTFETETEAKIFTTVYGGTIFPIITLEHVNCWLIALKRAFFIFWILLLSNAFQMQMQIITQWLIFWKADFYSVVDFWFLSINFQIADFRI